MVYSAPTSIPAGSNAPRPAGVPMARAQAESRLVERVFYRCHAHIAEIAQASSVPARFLGALTANESAGAPDAARFEPAVYRHLVAVASGEAPAYAGIQTAVHYPLPIHRQKAYAHLEYKSGDLPVTEALCEHCLSLPIYPELSKEKISRVTSILLDLEKSLTLQA